MNIGSGRSQTLLIGLIGAQAADAAFDAIALYPIAEATSWGDWAKKWAKQDLDRLSFPERFRFIFPIIKTASVVGLLVGFRWRTLARFTAQALVAYYILALGFHVRAKDRAFYYVPAVGMLVWSYQTLRAVNRNPI